MRARCAPTYGNRFMEEFEEKKIYSSHLSQIHHRHFDDLHKIKE